MKKRDCAFFGPDMAMAMASTVQLRRAVYCENCEAIFDRSAASKCPVCESASTFPLGRWIESPQLNSRILNPTCRGWRWL